MESERDRQSTGCAQDRPATLDDAAVLRRTAMCSSKFTERATPRQSPCAHCAPGWQCGDNAGSLGHEEMAMGLCLPGAGACKEISVLPFNFFF